MEYLVEQGIKQTRNAGRLLVKASDLNMDVTGYGQLAYNNCSGNTYLWLEDYQFTLFISDFDNAIKALYTCPYDGEETERNVGNSLEKLEKWCERLQRKSDKKEGI